MCLTVSSFDKLLKEKEAIEVEYLDFKRQVELTTDGVATKEIRMLKSVIKNLEEELTMSRTKHQRSTAKRNQQCQQLSEEVRLPQPAYILFYLSFIIECLQYCLSFESFIFYRTFSFLYIFHKY